MALLAAGALTSISIAVLVARSRPIPIRSWLSIEGVAAAALVAVGTITPVTVWRIASDIRYTSSLDFSAKEGAGPIQTFLQPYLLDDAARALPEDATYFAVAGAGVPYPVARTAFPSLALNVLFPRLSRSDPRDADWIVAWGVDPQDVAAVEDVRVVTPRSGPYPPVVVARVAGRS